MKTFIITGCGKFNSLGHEIVKAIRSSIPNAKIFGVDMHFDDEMLGSSHCDGLMECDVSDFNDVRENLKDCFSVDVLINCAGVNDINWLEDLEPEEFDRIINTNAKSIYNTSRVLLNQLSSTQGTILNIVSNASHMPMTCSLAYNASKGAAHIMTQQLARELTKKNGITVFGISPNKLAGTNMSNYIDERVPITRGWTREQSDAYQANSILAGEETDPKILAEFIAFLLTDKARHKFLTGCIIPYGA